MRYAIDGSDDKYGVTFTTVPYDPDDNLWANALETDREYRELIFLQHQEAGELAGRHAEERIRYIAVKRRQRNG